MNNEFCPQDCEHLNFNEAEQNYVNSLTKSKPAHWCHKYDVRLYHFLAHPNLYKCEKCLQEGND